MENTNGDHGLLLIPGDVLIQILVWLPVISLLRFKSVCKSWRALIQSSFFIHLHATTSCSSSNKFGTFILETSLLLDPTETRITRMIMLTPSRRRSGGGEVFEVEEDLGFPPICKSEPARWEMVGSCNGLICSKLGRVVSLWNPATRQFRILPKSSSLTLEEEEDEKIGRILVQDEFGFGFDVKTKDYKVVQITNFSLPRKMEFRVQVYSLSTNSWRRVLEEEEDIMISLGSLFPKEPPFQGFLDMSISGLYLNGSFFFNGIYVNESGFNRWVFSFDFTNEIFTPMKLFPDALNSTILILTYFGADKIAFSSVLGELLGGETYYDIWVLNNEHDQEEEEEVEESCYWTKLQHSIQRSTGDSSYNTPIAISDDGKFSNTPLAILDDGKFALIETRGHYGNDTWDSKLQLFNLVTKEEKTVFYSSIMRIQGASVYKPSLVSVIGGGGNGNGTAASAADDRVVIGGTI